MIVEDLAELGVNEILFFEQARRGGPFLHPTTVEHAATDPRMKGRGRDYLGELLAETGEQQIRVWLAWTTPEGEYPGTEFRRLNHPAILRIYTDEIEEVAARYGRHRNLAGIMWHEVDCSEHPDLHEDDVKEFCEFCLRDFGEEYTGDTMPRARSQDKWWRRFCHYEIDVVNRFVAKTAQVARQHGFKTHFCSYTPECFAGESWRRGYDIVALERLCDQQWFSGYAVESGKPYQNIKGAWLDFGPSYRGQNLPRNYAYTFHGKPLCYFEYRTPVYNTEMRRHYSPIASFTEKYGDVYNRYLGHTEKELSLFFGKENLWRWLTLAAWWQGGEPRH